MKKKRARNLENKEGGEGERDRRTETEEGVGESGRGGKQKTKGARAMVY
jgi:hypothetical protein